MSLELSNACEDLVTAWLAAAAAAPGSDCAALAQAVDGKGVAAARSLKAGHAIDGLDNAAYLVTMAHKSGGKLQSTGIYEVPMELILRDYAIAPGFTAAAASARAIEGLMESRNKYAVIASLQAFGPTINSRAVITGYRPADPFSSEGRDPEKRHIGAVFNFFLWASLKADNQ